MKKSKKKKEGLHEYLVTGYLTITVQKTIMAKNEEEARSKAESLSTPSLCHQCANSGEDSDEEWELNGFDDVPEDNITGIEKMDEDDAEGEPADGR